MMDPHQSQESTLLHVPDADYDSDEVETLEATVEDLPTKRRLSRPHLRQLRLRPSLARARQLDRRDQIRLISALLLVVLLVGAGVAYLHSRSEIQLAKVRQGNITLSFATTGVLQTATYDANFSGSGRIAEIDVKVGQQVNEGDILAKLDTTLLQDAVNEAQAGVSAAQSKVSDAQNNQQSAQAQSSAQVAAAYSQEQADIKACRIGDQTCVQKAQDQYAAVQATADHADAVAQAQVNDAQAQVSAAQAKLQTAQDNLNGATLKAPHDGTIGAINGAVGSTLVGSNATAPVSTFITIADLNALQVLAHVPAVNIGLVAEKNPVHFTVASTGAQTFAGTVVSVSPIGDNTASGVTYPVTIDVDMTTVHNAHLFTGMSANVSVITQQRFGVTLIPASAVVFANAAADSKHGGFLTKAQVSTALSEARQLMTVLLDSSADVSADQPTPAYVLTRTKDNWVMKPVVLGLTDGNVYEVLDGLKAGDTVVSGETNSSVVVPTPTATAGAAR